MFARSGRKGNRSLHAPCGCPLTAGAGGTWRLAVATRQTRVGRVPCEDSMTQTATNPFAVRNLGSREVTKLPEVTEQPAAELGSDCLSE